MSDIYDHVAGISTGIINDTHPLAKSSRQGWMSVIAQRIMSKWHAKFEAGMVEHENDIGELTVNQLLDEMEAEALDQLSYINEMRRRYTR
jgi:hypothetical protein